MELKGENIPKATMISYLKDKFKSQKVSNQVVEGMLVLSKEYITKISNQANQICSEDNKKTISLEHLYQSIEHFKLSKHMEELKKVEVEIKEGNQQKNQIKKQIQKNYDEMIKQNAVFVRQNSNLPILKQIKQSSILIDIQSEEQDYQQQCEIQNVVILEQTEKV